MTAPGPDDARTEGEAAQPRAASDAGVFELSLGTDVIELDWQPELDSALEAIDLNLPVKRRRSTDPPGTPPFPRPELSALAFTPEILDALATRVAAKLRPVEPVAAPPVLTEPPPLKAGALVTIRFRWPLLGRRSRRTSARA